MVKGQPLKFINGHNRTLRRVGVVTELICAHCKQNLDVSNFYIRKGRQTYRTTCKTCDAHDKRRRNYRMTPEEFSLLLDVQANSCAICGDTFAEPKDIHVDHNHITGQVRELLCRHCNQGLGHFRDSTILLASARAYLQKHEVIQCP